MRFLLKNTNRKQILFKLSWSSFQGQRMILSFVESVSIVLPRVFDSDSFTPSVFKVLARLKCINKK